MYMAIQAANLNRKIADCRQNMIKKNAETKHKEIYNTVEVNS